MLTRRPPGPKICGDLLFRGSVHAHWARSHLNSSPALKLEKIHAKPCIDLSAILERQIYLDEDSHRQLSAAKP